MWNGIGSARFEAQGLGDNANAKKLIDQAEDEISRSYNGNANDGVGDFGASGIDFALVPANFGSTLVTEDGIK